MKRPHRFVVVRRPIPQDPEDSAQLTLFKDRKYAYHVLVTNLTLSPWRVYRFYSVRATIEKNIREFVYDYPLGKIPTDTWTANVAFFQLVLFAADIVHWFKRLCLPPQYLTTTLDSIRTDFLVLPATIGAREQAQCRQASARLSLPARVPRGVAQGRSPAVASKFPNLQMTDLCFSSEAGQKIPSFAHF